jgi:hypothetical protein
VQATEYDAKISFYYFNKNVCFGTADIVQILENCTIME